SRGSQMESTNNESPCGAERSADDLLACARTGQWAEVGAVFERLRPALLSRLKRILYRHEDREDAIQEGFLKVLASLDQFEPGGGRKAALAWVTTIVVNCARDFRRRAQARRLWRALRLEDVGEAVAAGNADPADLAANRELCDLVRRRLSVLEPEARATLTL